jgi:hypothetical protein
MTSSLGQMRRMMAAGVRPDAAEPHVRRGQLAALTAWRTPHEISRCSRRLNDLGLTTTRNPENVGKNEC